ncbi:helix-turn-helix transcriptional regulator [Nonomuraea longicatena]|uniref:Helix-turn-helix transcriptional regulator n=1 Tax=Nonomuraea longicatena TaxID=83682 RepID=A0ABN1QJE9_9ACTN
MPPARDLDGGASPLAYFGAELRRLRVQAGLSQDQVGEAVFCSGSLIGLIENAKRSPLPDLAQRCDELLKTDGVFTRLLPLLRVSSHPSWFRSWIDVEREARTLCTWEPLIIPGLLQTEEYARAILSRQPGISPDRIEEQVAARLDRQTILVRDDPLLLWAVLDEGVLHRPIGEPHVMRDQLDALITASTRTHITVQVVPLDAGLSCGLVGAFAIASLQGGPDMVYLESEREGRVTDLPDDVAAVTNRYRAICADALPARASIDLIERVIKEKWTQT